MPTLVFCGPSMLAFIDKWGVAANQPNLAQFPTNFWTKLEMKGGPLYENNCQFIYFGPHNMSRFEQMWVSANPPKMDQFEFLQQFPVQKKFKKGIY